MIASLYKNQEGSLEEWSNAVLNGEKADTRDVISIQAEIDLLASQLFDLGTQELQVIYKTFHKDGTVDGLSWTKDGR